MTLSRALGAVAATAAAAEVLLLATAMIVAEPASARAQRGRRAPVAMMNLAPTGWTTGGAMPARHTQAGAELSPALRWTGAPDDAVSFVLIVHDATVPMGNGIDDLLYWMLWNIPASTTSLPEGVPSASELPDGTRQLSASGPYYRGPARAADDPAHHVIFDLYALDTMIDVPAVSDSPADTRAAVLAAIAGHVRGKATIVALH